MMDKEQASWIVCPKCNAEGNNVMGICTICGYEIPDAPWIPSGTTCRNCRSLDTYSDPFDTVVACKDCGYAYWLDGSFEQIR